MESLLDRAKDLGLEKQYNAVTGAADNKAQKMAEFTAAALRDMFTEDLADKKAKVTKLFELTKEVREEAGVGQGEEAKALPDALNAVESMLQNPALKKAVIDGEKDKLKECLAAAKRVAEDKGINTKAGVLSNVLRSPGNLEKDKRERVAKNIDEVMRELGITEESSPELIRGAIVQLLSQEMYKEENQEIINTFLKADIDKVTEKSAGAVAFALLDKAWDNKDAVKDPLKSTSDKDPSKTAKVKDDTTTGKDKDTAALLARIAALEKELAELRAGLGKGAASSTIIPGASTTTTVIHGKDGTPGAPGSSTTIIQGKDGKEGRDGRDGSASAPSSPQSSASPQAAAEGGSRPGYSPRDIMDSQTDSHGSYKMWRNIAIVCAVLSILSGGAIGIFLLGALVGGGMALYNNDKMQTEKRQLAKQWNIQQGLVDPGEYRQQQMEQHMSQELGQLREQLQGARLEQEALRGQLAGTSKEVDNPTTPNPALADPKVLGSALDSRSSGVTMADLQADSKRSAIAAMGPAVAGAAAARAKAKETTPPPPSAPPSSDKANVRLFGVVSELDLGTATGLGQQLKSASDSVKPKPDDSRNKLLQDLNNKNPMAPLKKAAKAAERGGSAIIGK